jgi:50S ribosomal protein L16 3-hydroxylase
LISIGELSQFVWIESLEPMDTSLPLALLGGITPQQFMQRYWQKKPLLIRNAVPGLKPLLSRAQLMALTERDEVESRLVVHGGKGWRMSSGPFARRAFPPLSQPKWTFLVQGMDLHDDGVRQLMEQFRFVPDARLDDLMISYATDGGGVGPHYDSYDVFLLQAQGQRRWRIGRQKDLSLEPDVPLKILSKFEPEMEYLLEPGDMLYLPPKYAHDGVAVGECMTYSIGFKVPAREQMGTALLQRLVDDPEDSSGPDVLYKDPHQVAVDAPAMMPIALQDFARQALRTKLQEALADVDLQDQVLGEHLTEPKAAVWFEPGSEAVDVTVGVALDKRTRMLYDEKHVYINGESYRAGGKDAKLMRALADTRCIDATTLRKASVDALGLLTSWCEAGWAHASPTQG